MKPALREEGIEPDIMVSWAVADMGCPPLNSDTGYFILKCKTNSSRDKGLLTLGFQPVDKAKPKSGL